MDIRDPKVNTLVHPTSLTLCFKPSSLHTNLKWGRIRKLLTRALSYKEHRPAIIARLNNHIKPATTPKRAVMGVTTTIMRVLVLCRHPTVTMGPSSNKIPMRASMGLAREDMDKRRGTVTRGMGKDRRRGMDRV